MDKNLTLLTDFYELTMMNGYLQNGMADKVAVFDLFFRQGNESTFCIACGLEQAIDYIKNISFGKEEIEYLRSLGTFGEDFLSRLAGFKFKGDVRALPEGTVVFPNEPLMVIKGSVFEAQLLEAALLNIVNFQTLIATKAARVVRAARGRGVLEFGLRRAQAPDAAVYGARAAVIGGCVSTSNVLASMLFDTDPKGTHAHSWIMSFDDELSAFRAYAELYPTNCLLLIDTYDTLKSGLPNAITVFRELKEKGYKPVGVRLDSGDLAYLTKETRRVLDEAGFPEAKIFVSGDLDEYTIESLYIQGAKIDVYGVGTRLITSHSNPSLGGVYKIAEFDGRPKLKISDNAAKITNPGEKEIYRIYDGATKMAVADLICLKDEKIDFTAPLTLTHPTDRWKKLTLTDYFVRPLLVDVMKNGEDILERKSVTELRSRCNAGLNEFWSEYKRLDKPQIYKVDLSDELYNLKQELLAKGGKK